LQSKGMVSTGDPDAYSFMVYFTDVDSPKLTLSEAVTFKGGTLPFLAGSAKCSCDTAVIMADYDTTGNCQLILFKHNAFVAESKNADSVGANNAI